MISSFSKELMARHPLQHMASPSRGASMALHTLSLCSFAGSFWYLVKYPSWINDSYGWHFQHFTNIGLAGATITFIFGLLADVTLSPKVFLIKNTLAICAAPVEVFISTAYSLICSIDRSLLIGPEIEMAPIADYGFHLIPAVVLIIDLLFFSPPWTINALPAAGISSLIAFLYWAWVEVCFKHNGRYPYPLFSLLNTNQRALFFALCASILTGSMLLLTWLHRRLNNVQSTQERASPANIKGE